MLTTWLLLLAGLALLILGGDLLVRGAVRVAERFGVSPLLIGLTLVGFGTSTPELVTSVRAALADAPGIAYGNIVGSNIANILLIIGAAALVGPLSISTGALKRDGVLMLVVTVLFAILAAALSMTRVWGLVFIAALAGYVLLTIRMERAAAASAHGAIYDKATALEEADPATRPSPVATAGLLASLGTAVAGLGLVVVGGGLLVDSAVALARSLGISEIVIGLTIVAIGTSLPELVTSVVAAFRRQSEVAFGNIVGSNLYNVLGIGGMTALIAPTEVPQQIVRFDNPVMVVATLLVLAMAYTGRRISRKEGLGLLTGYIVYLWWLWPV